ncbi:MAG: hypothetical protein OIF50_09910 [Flavobacteriaceae bacterium]|nr:hypothetical protein [Flavobacteriaceae bacterium]
MKKVTTYLIALFGLGLMVSCGDSGPVDPVAAILVFPEKNAVCQEGKVINETKSEVVFRWNKADGADKYKITVVNLNTQGKSFKTVEATEYGMQIDRGVPYEWYITSISNSVDKPMDSEKWRFFNAGAGVESHPPFPATAVSPKPGNTLDAAGDKTIEWEASDVDDDIVSYDLLFDTVNPPVASAGNFTTTSAVVTTTASTQYYWRVIAKDAKNNTSMSEVFTFAIK